MLRTGCLRRYDASLHTCTMRLLVILSMCHVFVHFQSTEVKYVTLHSLDEVLELFTNQEKEEDEEEEDEEEEEDLQFGKI